MFGLAARYGPNLFEVGQLALVNGELGLYTAGWTPAANGPRCCRISRR